MERGDQIAYIPGHARGIGLGHKDVEFGFITGVRLNNIFCRFWSRADSLVLRTTSCSEGCNVRDLMPFNTHPDSFITKTLNEIAKEEDG